MDWKIRKGEMTLMSGSKFPKHDLPPQVQFSNLHDTYSINRWRKLTGKGDGYPLQIRSNTWLMDLRLERGEEIALPEAPLESCAFLLYVFDGKIT